MQKCEKQLCTMPTVHSMSFCCYFWLHSQAWNKNVPSSWYAVDLCTTLVHKHEMKHTFFLVCDRSTCTCHFCEMNTSPQYVADLCAVAMFTSQKLGLVIQMTDAKAYVVWDFGQFSQTRETTHLSNVCATWHAQKASNLELWTLMF